MSASTDHQYPALLKYPPFEKWYHLPRLANQPPHTMPWAPHCDRHVSGDNSFHVHVTQRRSSLQPRAVASLSFCYSPALGSTASSTLPAALSGPCLVACELSTVRRLLWCNLSLCTCGAHGCPLVEAPDRCQAAACCFALQISLSLFLPPLVFGPTVFQQHDNGNVGLYLRGYLVDIAAISVSALVKVSHCVWDKVPRPVLGDAKCQCLGLDIYHHHPYIKPGRCSKAASTFCKFEATVDYWGSDRQVSGWVDSHGDFGDAQD